MVYDEVSIPAIQKAWEKSFEARYRRFTTIAERNHTLEVMLKEMDGDRQGQLHPVTLKIRVYSDNDTEQLTLGGVED